MKGRINIAASRDIRFITQFMAMRRDDDVLNSNTLTKNNDKKIARKEISRDDHRRNILQIILKMR